MEKEISFWVLALIYKKMGTHVTMNEDRNAVIDVVENEVVKVNVQRKWLLIAKIFRKKKKREY